MLLRKRESGGGATAAAGIVPVVTQCRHDGAPRPGLTPLFSGLGVGRFHSAGHNPQYGVLQYILHNLSYFTSAKVF